MNVFHIDFRRVFLGICCLLIASINTTFANVNTDEIYKRIWKLEKIKATKVSQADEIFVKFDLSGKMFVISGTSWNSETWSIDKLNNLTANLLGEEKWRVQLLNSSLLVLIPKESYDASYTFIEMTNQEDIDRLAGIFKEINLNLKGLASMIKPSKSPIATKIYDQSSNHKILKTATQIEQEEAYINDTESPIAAVNADKIDIEYYVDSQYKSAPTRIKKEPVSSYIKVKSAEAPSIYTANKNKYSSRTTSMDRVNIPRKYVEPFTVSKNDYIEVFISGGGFKGGINPKIHDRILIHNNGLVQKEYISVHGGEENFTRRIDKDKLVELAQLIVNSDYFNFKESYDCEANDRNCQQAVNGKPEPIPLKLVIAVGMLRHIVDVPVFAPGINDTIGYPKSLEDIVEAIYNVARN